MQWFYEWQKQESPKLSEEAVNCVQCRVVKATSAPHPYNPETKCCEFSPFVSCFALGRLIQQGADLSVLYRQSENHLVATQLGLIHSHSHRQTSHSLCQFFDRKSKACQIWSQRPAICFFFFCVTEKKGQWNALEHKVLEKEAELLQRWFFEQGGSEQDWARWGLIMEPQPVIDIPESLVFDNWNEARSWYLQSYEWLNSQQR